MEFTIEGRTYKVGKIDARTQFHIVRRLAPILGEIAPVLKDIGGSNGLDAIPPIADALAKLSDADADYCIFGLLKVIYRKQDNDLGWGAVATGESLMYEDITMPIMLQLAWKALSFNMSSFFSVLPAGLKEAAQKASAQ
jgi:hypothetical protein